MNATGEGTGRRTRRMGVMATLIVAAATLAGCSSSNDSFDEGAASMGDAGGEVAQEGAVEDGADAAAETVAQDRSLIITGSLYITVEDPLAAASQAAVIVQGAGGRVDARDETAANEYDGGSASLTLRIPDDDLDAVVDDLRALGTVDEFATESRDVTTEVTDLDAKISTLRASTNRIQGLLVEAEDIEDIIALENELSSRQAELESLEAQQRGLSDQVSMSTIYLSLTTEPVVLVDDSPQTFAAGVASGWDALVAFVSGALVITGVLLPWAALAALVTVALFLVIRARRSRVARPAPGAPATTAPQPAGETTTETTGA